MPPPGICRPRQSLVQILIVLSWKHVNQAWKLFGSCKVGGYGLSIPKAFVETSLLIFPVTHYDKMHIQTPHNCLCPFEENYRTKLSFKSLGHFLSEMFVLSTTSFMHIEFVGACSTIT